jgi:hypothetical protein
MLSCPHCLLIDSRYSYIKTLTCLMQHPELQSTPQRVNITFKTFRTVCQQNIFDCGVFVLAYIQTAIQWLQDQPSPLSLPTTLCKPYCHQVCTDPIFIASVHCPTYENNPILLCSLDDTPLAFCIHAP